LVDTTLRRTFLLTLEVQARPSGKATKTTPAEATGASFQAHGFTIYDGMLLSVVLVWAANPAAIKWALKYIDPLTFNALRFSLAALVPVVLLLASKEKVGWHGGDGLKLLTLGLVGHGVYQTLFILAIDKTLAGNTALILSINPAFVAILSALLGYERLRGYAWAGVSLSLAGVGLVILGSGETLELGSRLFGDVLMLVVTLIWALYTVFSQHMLKRYSPVKLNALTMPVGAVVLGLVAAPSVAASTPRWPSVPMMAWLILIASGVLAVAISYLIWGKGLQKLGGTRTAVYTNLVPVLAGLIAFFALGEPLGWQYWAGMVIVLAGVSLTRFGGRLMRGIRG
jgi:drug/metabolite transporter (DMT)-like permease